MPEKSEVEREFGITREMVEASIVEVNTFTSKRDRK